MNTRIVNTVEFHNNLNIVQEQFPVYRKVTETMFWQLIVDSFLIYI